VPAVIDPTADPRWEELVTRAGAPVFHHSAWLRHLGDAYGYEVMAPCVDAGDGTLAAGLPVALVSSRLTGRRLVALPFSDLCPPLVAPDAAGDTTHALAEELHCFARSSGLPLQVRGGDGVLDDAPVEERFHHHLLQLEPNLEAVERRMRPQALRGVRRALRERLTAEMRTDRGGLADFYRLHVLNRRRLGVPTQPKRFMLGLERLFGEGLGFVLVVRRDGRALAAAVFLTHGGVLTYKYGASDPGALAARPNNLLFAEAIRWGCEHGYRSLDFGRTHWGQESLCRFKRAWGAEQGELHYRRLGPAQPHGGGERAERLLGTVIRRSPPVVGRAIGEVLYRHAG
jgi:CelD/BcsL family acetyltransferase involved in cellulose biosynthesis